jgi:hypothetical protein
LDELRLVVVARGLWVFLMLEILPAAMVVLV